MTEKLNNADESGTSTQVPQADWSFDLKILAKHLNVPSDLEGTVRGHLYLENVVIAFLQHALEKPELLDVERVPFNLKVEFAAALGLIPTHLIPILKKINTIRNHLSHNLKYSIPDQAKNDLLNLFRPSERELVLEVEGEGQSVEVTKVPISHFIKVVIVLLDLHRQSYVKWRAERQEALENARRVLSKVKREEAAANRKNTK